MIALQPAASCAIAVVVIALVNALWQPALIAAISAVALRVSRCTNATTRHAVWTLALIASACVPVLSATSLVLPRSAVETAASSAPVARVVKRITEIKAVQSVPAAGMPAVHRPKIVMEPTLAQIIVDAWAIVAVLILARLAFSFFYLERLKRDALPLSVDRRHALTRWDRAEKGQRDVRVCVSDEIRVPVAIGIFDAMILLPHDLVEELDATDLDRILLHELAHVRRSDDWVNLFERIAVALYFFSPGIYWIARQMDLEREVACDDWVLAQAAENASYARCLARIVEMTQWPYRPVAAPGVFVTRKSMSIRIERLLARGRDIRIRLAIVPSVVSVAAIVAIVIAGGFISPTIAYTMSEPLVTTKPMQLKPPAVAAKPSFHPSEAAKARPTVAPTPPPTPVVAKHDVVAQATFAPESVVAETGYLDELKEAGLTNLDADTVIALKSVGVTRDYVNQMRNAGVGPLTARQLIELKSVGVTPDYISTMRSAGLAASDARGWTELRSIGLTPDYVSEMRSAGLRSADARAWAELKSIGVTPDYVQELANAGYAHLSSHEYSELRSLGVDGAYIGRLAEHGFKNLPVHKLVEFKAMGIDPK